MNDPISLLGIKFPPSDLRDNLVPGGIERVRIVDIAHKAMTKTTTRLIIGGFLAWKKVGREEYRLRENTGFRSHSLAIWLLVPA